MKEILVFEGSGVMAEHMCLTLVKEHPDKIMRFNKALREIILINGDRIKCYWPNQRIFDGLSGDVLVCKFQITSSIDTIVRRMLARGGELWTMQELEEYMEGIT